MTTMDNNNKNNNDHYNSFDDVHNQQTSPRNGTSTTSPEDKLELEKDSFTDGYRTWSGSLLAFQYGMFHIVIYMTCGVIGYSYLLRTKWSVIDSLYFSTVIFTTVGYGDLSPNSTQAGMVFTIFHALYGIVIIGIFLGEIGNAVIERQRQMKKDSLQRTRKILLDNITKEAADNSDNNDDDNDNDKKSLLLQEEFDDTHMICSDFGRICKEQIRNIIFLLLISIPIILLEKWSIVKGLYWIMITATTIGLGDETPENPWSKMICIVYIPLLVAFCGSFLGQIATSYVDKRNDRLEAQFFNRAVITESDIEKMDLDDNGYVTKDEFLIFMLLTLQKVESADIDEIVDLFHKLDKDNSGTLCVDDIATISNQTVKLHEQSLRQSLRKR